MGFVLTVASWSGTASGAGVVTPPFFCSVMIGSCGTRKGILRQLHPARVMTGPGPWERSCPASRRAASHALRYLYDHRPAMSLRAIGATPEVDLHHDNVGKIRAGATAVFGTAPGAGRT